MNKYYRFIEYAYLAIAIFLIVETIRTWGDNNKTFIFLAMAIMATAMYFFRRWFRKKMEKQNK